MKMKTGIDCKNKVWNEVPLKSCKNITNITFDHLTAQFRVSGDFIKPSDKSAWWLFKCSCGNEIALKATEVRYGKVHSCGCYKKQLMSETKSAHLEGQVFGKLTVLEAAGSNNTQKRVWKCQCECGNITYATTGSLKSRKINSCGCLHQSVGELIIEQLLKNNNINYIYNKEYFKDLILFNGGIGRYDFILLDDNNEPYRIIEFDGIQHYIPTSFYYGHTKENNYLYTKQNDDIKNQYALSHNIPLVRIPYTEINHITIDMLLNNNKYLIRGVVNDE